MNISYEEYFSLSRELEACHSIFYKIWEMGKPVFTDGIPTAAIGFNVEGGYVQYFWNPDYWTKCDNYKRAFVICHECLHVILDHGYRAPAKDKENAEFKEELNIAMDIVVNHLLINKFGFDRTKIEGWEDACWVDTVWPNDSIEDDRSFEYYFNLLKNPPPPSMEMCGEGGGGGYPSEQPQEEKPKFKPQLMDDHSLLPSEDDLSETSEGYDALRETMQEVAEELPEYDKERLMGRMAGTEAGDFVMVMPQEKVKIKKKWETVIKRWSLQFDKPDIHDVEQWARANRRMASMPTNLFLPADMEQDKNVEGKIEVWFFQDTSGSCMAFAKRFFACAKSLNPKRFNIRMFCFDTRVFPTTLESGKLYGFGGTSFSILENYIQKELSNDKKLKYPKAVFVITDGYGDTIKPAKPDRWYWFLSTTYRGCIDSKCNFFNLADFE